MPGLRFAPNEDVPGLEIAMHEPEVVEERERAQRLGREWDERARSLALDRRDEVVAVYMLHRELRAAGRRVDQQLVDFDQAWVLERCERRELASEGGFVLV